MIAKPRPGDIYKRTFGGKVEYWLLCNKGSGRDPHIPITAWCCAILRPCAKGILGFSLHEPRLASDETLEKDFTYHDTIARLITEEKFQGQIRNEE